MGFFNDMKTCTKCKIEKEFIEFRSCKSVKSGLRANCKKCDKEYTLQYHLKNKEILNKKSKTYRINNVDKVTEYNKTYRLENIDKYKQYAKGYHAKYRKARMKKDPLFKLNCSISSLIRMSIRGNGYKKTSRTHEIIGCSYEEFKIHLEKQFTEGMNWSNYGKWHMDHIYPVSRATDEQHLIKLNHYTNFQPLWAEDNIKKSNKI
jgi:hypothetical protein